MMNINEFLNELSAKHIKLWVDDDQLRYRASKKLMTPELLNKIRENKTEIISFLKLHPESAEHHPKTVQKTVQHIEPPSCDDRLIWDVYTSMYHLPALAAADELCLFSFLEKKPATREEISDNLNLDPRGAEALLGVLSSLGLLIHDQELFSNTPESRNFLLPHSPYYWGGVLHNIRRTALPVYRELLAVLRKPERGTSGTQKQFDFADQWESGNLDPEEARWRTRFMHSHSFPAAMNLGQHLDLAGASRFLDVAGGSGGFCIALAMKNPDVHFTLMDLPPVCEVAKEYIADYGLTDQIETYPADMFKSPWPSGYDAVFFSDIFHDWDWETCIYLGRRSFETLLPGARIFLHEMLLEDRKDSPLAAAAYSMNMLLSTEGKQFTGRELDELLKKCGFADVSITPAYGYFSLITARKL